jgi:hypothetical protein
VHLNELCQREPPAFGLEVQPLPSHHPFNTAGVKELFGHGSDGARRQVKLRRGYCQQPGGDGHQQKANPGGGGNVEGAVGSGTASAEIVVVHAGQIVVDQRVGVDRFNRCGHTGNGLRPSTDRSIGSHEQCCPNSLAGCSQRIGQRLTLAAPDFSLEPLGPPAQQTVGTFPGLSQKVRYRRRSGLRHRGRSA